ncbi:hypothetical protein JIN77_07680 [Verrucomicrobiaceae bacterium R5-34]|uniref:EF-hand domain-containing protein n=1 Tax=Oceaniferula flava TaxID=2800421 RepID=A0AAE2V987_9BACT|nr:hypothetical protein [Oceaniferula flavus]MBK1830602.1 hypothetical protein [Verrucomicrobiaceae bacterium R5-34]MBK1854698.1 hypothetical protein [Oceaniferula flavus]MBM1136004.1 hypothetical protein [Oceaniferula flavus]
MKMTKTIITAAAAALALSVTAYAEKPEKGAKKGREGKGPSPEQREAMKKKMLERFDADKDGTLSDAEKKTARETISKERKEIKAATLAKFDADKDGKLSKEEREGVREWVKATYPDAIQMAPGKRGGAKGGRGKKGGDE